MPTAVRSGAGRIYCPSEQQARIVRAATSPSASTGAMIVAMAYSADYREAMVGTLSF